MKRTRRQQLALIDLRLRQLQAEHPVFYWLVVSAIAALVAGLALIVGAL